MLVQCQSSSAGLATEWRQMVDRPFKAGFCPIRGLKPSATISRHSVTNTNGNGQAPIAHHYQIVLYL